MNERIKELADQLGPVATIGNWGRVEWSDNIYPQIGDRMYAAIDLEKFAELIVRECSRVIVNGGYWSSGLIGPKRQCTPPEIAQMIKQHFGVEE
jgi:hypothetical protein